MGHAGLVGGVDGDVAHERDSGGGTPLRSALSLIAPVRASVGAGMALQVLGSALSAVPLLALAALAARLTGGEPGGATGPLVVFLTGLGASTLCGALALLVTHLADVELQARLRLRVADTLARLPLGWFDERSSGRVRQLVQNDVESLHQLVAHSAVELVAGVLTPLVGLAVCLGLDWRLGLAAVVPVVLYAAAYAVLSAGSDRQVMDRVHEGLAGVSEAIVEYVEGISVLKIFGRADQGSQRFTERSERFLFDFEGLVRPQMRAHSVAVVFLSAATAGVVELAVGLWSVRQGWSDAADILVVTVVAMVLPATVQTVAVSGRAVGQSLDAAHRIREILDTPPLPVSEHPQEPRGSEVELVDVTFGYDPEHPAVRGLSATLPAGGVTALVGPSGSGKSTVAALVARFRDPDSGSVRIGGVDVREIAPGRLRRTVGTVLQDPHLLILSVAENIRLGAPEASGRQVREAARVAGIDRRVQALPRGYDSVVGVDARLSGGQAQRVAIARALLADTPVLVLDEATSAADPESETVVQQGIDRLTAGRTVVVIAHRLSTVAGADQILVLDRGEIVERGTHSELLAAGGLYARLWADSTTDGGIR